MTCLKCLSRLDRLRVKHYPAAMERTNDTNRSAAGYPTDSEVPSGKTDGIAIDPRVQRTRRAIWLAVLDLTREEGFHNVTVARIARRAGINRSTFYAHFPDRHAVVREELARLLRDLRARQEQPTPESMFRFDPQTPHPNALRWFAHVAAHEAFYSALLVTGELAAFEGEVAALINGWAETRLREWPGGVKPAIPVQALIAASTAMNLGLVRWWLAQDPRPSLNEMAVIQQRLQTSGVLPLLGLDGTSP